MEKFLSYQEILKKCDLLNEDYQINEAYFFDIIDKIYQGDHSTDEVVKEGFQQLLKQVDVEINKMEAHVDMKPTCFKGCAFCCYFPIIVTKLEAKTMIRTIQDWPAERKNKIVAHLEQYFEKYEGSLAELMELDFEDNPDLKYKYISKQVPCPMLDTETNTCIAYEIRPIPCRTYLNYADPKVCATNLVPKEPFSYEFLYEFYMGALNELFQALYEDGEELFVEYPEDVWAYNYLPAWLKELQNEWK